GPLYRRPPYKSGQDCSAQLGEPRTAESRERVKSSNPPRTTGKQYLPQAVILVSLKPGGFSPQILVTTGNKRLDASFLETKASTTFNADSAIPSSLETIMIGTCGRRRFISIASSCPFISGMW